MIKDQCDNCNKQGTFNCSLNIVFNGLTCDMYSKRISLEKTTENTERTVDGVETGTNDNQSSGSYKIDLVKHGDTNLSKSITQFKKMIQTEMKTIH